MVRPQDAKINALSRLIDAGIICCTLVALVSILQLEWLPSYNWLLLIAILLFSFFTECSRTYKAWRDISISAELMAVISNWGAIVAIFVAIEFTFHPVDLYNREMVLYWFVLTPIELISWHSIMRMMLRLFRGSVVSAQKVAIYGATELGVGLEKRIQSMSWAGYDFVGYFDDRRTNGNRRFISDPNLIKGSSQDLIEQARRAEIDTIFITLPLAAEARIKSLLNQLSDTTVSAYMMLDLFSFDLLNASWLDIQGMPAVSIFESPHKGLDSISKRIFDVLCSMLILTLIAVPMLLIAAGIKLTSKGPVIFRQQRYGIGGEPISVWKFRTMICTESAAKQVVQASKTDRRITPFGRFLRRTSLDELPQFFNVIAGTMSIVGPRPLTPKNFDFYDTETQSTISKLKPGLTGVGSLIFRNEQSVIENSSKSTMDCYKSDITPYKGELEKWFSQNQSLYLYFLLIFLTAWVVFFPKSGIVWNVFSSLPTPPAKIKKQFKRSINV